MCLWANTYTHKHIHIHARDTKCCRMRGKCYETCEREEAVSQSVEDEKKQVIYTDRQQRRSWWVRWQHVRDTDSELGKPKKGEGVNVCWSREGRRERGERERGRETDSTWVLEGTGAFESQKSRSETWKRQGGERRSRRWEGEGQTGSYIFNPRGWHSWQWIQRLHCSVL